MLKIDWHDVSNRTIATVLAGIILAGLGLVWKFAPSVWNPAAGWLKAILGYSAPIPVSVVLALALALAIALSLYLRLRQRVRAMPGQITQGFRQAIQEEQRRLEGEQRQVLVDQVAAANARAEKAEAKEAEAEARAQRAEAAAAAPPPAPATNAVAELQTTVLRLLAAADGRAYLDTVYQKAHASKLLVDHALHGLTQRDLVQHSGGYGSEPFVQLTPKGREFVIEVGFVR